MAGTIPLSLTQQNDKFGKPLAGGVLFIYEAGTVSTPQIAYQDSALTIPVAGGNQITLDDMGRLPQFFLADGSVKIRLTDVDGVTQVTADGILVVGASSGGGGGSPVDPTTIFATGDLKVTYGTGSLSGFVRSNGRTIGSATSGASERANSDVQALFLFLWAADANLVVSTGRGVSAAADYAANKTIALPDWRGRALAGLDDMGNSAAGRLTSTYFGTAATALGAAGGNEKMPGLATTNLPAYTPTGTLTLAGTVTGSQSNFSVTAGGTGIIAATGTEAVTFGTKTFTGDAQGGVATAFSISSPMMLATIYLKL